MKPGRHLTRRQKQVVIYVAKSWTMKAIAATLRISQKTVEYHRKQLDEVLGGHDTALLTRYAISNGLIKL